MNQECVILLIFYVPNTLNALTLEGMTSIQNKLAFEIGILKGVAKKYPRRTIENIITQLEAKLKELSKNQ